MTQVAREETSSEALECLRALSIVLDLANGLREDKSLASGLFAHALALRLGESEVVAAEAFWASLLRHLGCTSYAHREALWVEDDVAFRRAISISDSSVPSDLARAIVVANPGGDSAAALRHLREEGPAERLRWTSEACEGARALASAMGFGEGVGRALEQVFERHDGLGVPRGLVADEISVVARVATVAHVTLAHHTQRGLDAACEVLEFATRRPGACDPAIAGHARALLAEHRDAMLDTPDERLQALSAPLAANGPAVGARIVAEAFGDFADLQSVYTRGHARGVATYVERGAAELGLRAAERDAALLAAHLHDVGAAAVPTRIWETRGAWSTSQAELARMHVYYTERVLSLAAPLRAAAPLAAGHHERLDASGYHRGVGAERIPIGARLLAVADVFHALREDRPHRAALTRSAAKDALLKLGREGGLDLRVIDAVVSSARSTHSAPSASVNSLTAREREVLRHVAKGHTNKEIGVALGISDRTVQTHTLNAYAKLGVTTRAAAAIAASRAGLLDLDD